MKAMGIPYRAAALAYRGASSVVIAIGIARVTDLLTPEPWWNGFTYYTVLSNTLCLAWLVLSAIGTARNGRRDGWRGFSTPSARIAGAVMMAITVTMLVYLFVLLPTLVPTGYEPFTLTDTLIHVVAPLLVIGDWLLFVPKGRLRPIDPVLWSAIPLAYLAFAFTWGGLGGEFSPGVRYPYPFLDVDANGVGGVALWVVGLTAGGIGLGYGYYGLDRLLSRGSRDA